MIKFRLPILLTIAIAATACGTLHNVPKEEVHIVVKDSTVVNIKDSINWIPKERIIDVVAQYDTLNLETSLAFAQSYVDTTTHTLKGKIENKEGVKTKYVYKTKIEYRDSVVVKEVPVEAVKEKKVVPKWCWRLLVFVAIEFLVFAAWIYLKISKVDISSLLKKR